MESGGGTAHQNASGVVYYGANAGIRGKSKCTVADNGTSGNMYVNDTQANWYYNSSTLGTDNYGFRVLPTGHRIMPAATFAYRGTNAYFWTSSAYNESRAWFRYYYFVNAGVARGYPVRSFGFSVRCIRN
jgi:uncharacterized protein (TIGR02145 family)